MSIQSISHTSPAAAPPSDPAAMGAALRVACERGSTALVWMLLQRASGNPAILNHLDSQGRSALQIATHFALEAVERRGARELKAYTEIIEMLLIAGASADVEDAAGSTPLMLVLSKGELDLARIFLKHGAKINKSDRQGYTALHKAVLENSESVVKFILDHGGEPNCRAVDGATPLVIACSKRSHAIASLLLAAHADPSLGVYKTKDGFLLTPLFWAFIYRDLRMIKLLVEAKPSVVNDGVKIAAYTHNGFSYACVMDDNEEMVAYLATFRSEFPREKSELLICAIGDHPEYEKYLTRRDQEQLSAHRLSLAAALANREDAPTVYEGGRGSIFYLDVAEAIRTAGLGELAREEIEASFRKAPSNIRNKPATLDAIHRGDLVQISAGWKRHVIALVFYRGYLVVCNRGEGSEEHATAEFYRIDPKAVKLEHLVEIERKKKEFEEQERAAPYFYDTLPKQLSPKHDNKIHRGTRCEKLAEAFSAGRQEVGNCPSASVAAALRASIGLVMLLGRKSEAATIGKVRKMGRKVLLVQRLRYLETYLGYHPEGDPTIDAFLVQESWKKIKRQLKRNPFALDAYPRVKARLHDPEERPLSERFFSAIGSVSKLFSGLVSSEPAPVVESEPIII